MKHGNRREMALSVALGLVVALGACVPTANTQAATERVTAAPTGEESYLAAAENRLDRALGIENSFTSDPEMRDTALDVANATCSLQEDGFTEAEIFDYLASADVEDESIEVVRYWVTAATTYVC